jgi:hypothetical protein
MAYQMFNNRSGGLGGYTQPRGGYIQPASFHTWTLAKAIFVCAALLLMITGIQDFLDPGRRQIPSVNIKAITSIITGFFMMYLFFTVINTPKYGR